MKIKFGEFEIELDPLGLIMVISIVGFISYTLVTIFGGK